MKDESGMANAEWWHAVMQLGIPIPSGTLRGIGIPATHYRLGDEDRPGRSGVQMRVQIPVISAHQLHVRKWDRF